MYGIVGRAQRQQPAHTVHVVNNFNLNFSAESALSAAISAQPKIEGRPCPPALTNARLKAFYTRSSLLSAYSRTNPLFQAATAKASTSRDQEETSVRVPPPIRPQGEVPSPPRGYRGHNRSRTPRRVARHRRYALPSPRNCC
jgi:hypothetical protein